MSIDRPASGQEPLGSTARPPRHSPAFWIIGILGLAALTFLAVVILIAGDETETRSTPLPGESSADAGFARDMQVHHAQAVDMSVMVRDRSTDPIIRAIALDILTAQQHQIGQMYAWLELWGLPQTGRAEPMAWMTGEAPDHAGRSGTGSAGEGSAAPAEAAVPMPGMATPAELRRLERAGARTAEVLWLQLMIRHHEAGVDMANAALRLADHPEVQQLAQSVVVSQQTEIEQLQQLLEDRENARNEP